MSRSVGWIWRYILFHNKRHPAEMSAADIKAFLAHLAAYEHVAPSTQNQALSVLLFLYRDVLNKEIDIVNVPWADKPKKLPNVLTPAEAQQVVAGLSKGTLYWYCKSVIIHPRPLSVQPTGVNDYVTISD